MSLHQKATLSCIAVIAALIYSAATATAQSQEEHLVAGFTLGKESLLRLLLNTDRPLNSKMEAVNSLLTLFDLRDQVSNRSVATAEGEKSISQEDNSTLTLLDEVIQDSCDYINLTLYDFTKNGNKDNYCITVMKQTFDCTREAAKMLQTKLELLMAFQTSKDKIEIGLLGGTSSPSLVGWIKDFESSYQTTTADDGINIVEFLKCVEENS